MGIKPPKENCHRGTENTEKDAAVSGEIRTIFRVSWRSAVCPQWLCGQSEWGVAAAGGKGAAAARGLLFAADRGGDEILDGVSCGVIPLFGERAAAGPGSEGRGG